MYYSEHYNTEFADSDHIGLLVMILFAVEDLHVVAVDKNRNKSTDSLIVDLIIHAMCLISHLNAFHTF